MDSGNTKGKYSTALHPTVLPIRSNAQVNAAVRPKCLRLYAWSLRVSAPGEVRPALERAFAANTPAAVKVMVERTYSLSGSTVLYGQYRARR